MTKCHSCCDLHYSYYYKQKSGKINKNGARIGIIAKLRPQVQTLIHIAINNVIRIENEIMKHPPLIGYDAWIVIGVSLLLLHVETGE